jgi:hypothetical protein
MLDPRRLSALGAAVLLAACVLAAEPRSGSAALGHPKEHECAALRIRQLGSPHYEDRETATRTLDTLGPAVLEPLRYALHSGDAETRQRARQLLQRIERRLETARLLEPTPLRLVYQDTPVSIAAADFGRKAGILFPLEGNRTRLAERRITLDTGDTTFWGALDAFCQKAGLAERPPNVDRGLDFRSRDEPREPRMIALGDVYADLGVRPGNQLVLREGNGLPLPTHLAGALRIRALTPSPASASQPSTEGEALLCLEVRLEPRLQLQSVLAVRLDRVVDERGQSRTLPANIVAEAGALTAGSGPQVLLLWDGLSELPTSFPGSTGCVLLRMRLPDRRSRRLAEMHGTVALQVQTAAETLVTVDQILQASGQAVRSDDGTTLKLLEVRRDEEGLLTLRIELTPPPWDLFVGGLPARIFLVEGGWWRGRGTQMPQPVHADQFLLLDGRGNKIPRTSAGGPTANGSGTAWELTLEYQPGPDQQEPARLVYSGRRTPTLEVAFILRDVPLP